MLSISLMVRIDPFIIMKSDSMMVQSALSEGSE